MHTIRVKDLFPDEKVMYCTSVGQLTVPSWYVGDLLKKLQETRDELERIKTGDVFSVGG